MSFFLLLACAQASHTHLCQCLLSPLFEWALNISTFIRVYNPVSFPLWCFVWKEMSEKVLKLWISNAFFFHLNLAVFHNFELGSRFLDGWAYSTKIQMSFYFWYIFLWYNFLIDKSHSMDIANASIVCDFHLDRIREASCSVFGKSQSSPKPACLIAIVHAFVVTEKGNWFGKKQQQAGIPCYPPLKIPLVSRILVSYFDRLNFILFIKR